MVDRLRKILSNKNGIDLSEEDELYRIYYLSPTEDIERIVECYTINRANYCYFLNEYSVEVSRVCDDRMSVISSGGTKFTFAEGVESGDVILPITVRMQMRFSIMNSEDCYISEEFIPKILELIHETMDLMISSLPASRRSCIICRNDPYLFRDANQIDISFTFPDAYITRDFLHGYFYKLFEVLLGKSRIMGGRTGHLKLPLYNQTLENTIISSYGNTYVPFYASVTGADREPLMIHSVVTGDGKNTPITYLFPAENHTYWDIIKPTRRRNRKMTDHEFDREDTISMCSVSDILTQVLALSLSYGDDTVHVIDNPSDVISGYLEVDPSTRKLLESSRSDLFILSNDELFEDKPPDDLGLKTAVMFLRMIPGKAKHVNTYIEVGKALYNVTNGDRRGFKVWLNYGVKNIGVYRILGTSVMNTLWSKFSKFNFITIRTIAFYAMKESEDVYTQWHRRWVERSFLDSLVGTESPVGKYFYRLYWLEFMYCSQAAIRGKCDGWYIFKGNGWLPTTSKELMKQVEDKMCKEYIYRRDELNRLIKNSSGSDSGSTVCSNDSTSDHLPKAKNNIDRIIRDLGRQVFKKNIVDAAGERFQDPFFLTKRDKDHNLTCMSNCVLESVDMNWIMEFAGDSVDMPETAKYEDIGDGVIEIQSGNAKSEILKGMGESVKNQGIPIPNEGRRESKLRKLFKRSGKPEDFLTKTTGVPYNDQLSWTSPIVKALLDWIHKIFPDEGLFYFFWMVATSMYSSRLLKLILAWDGIGNNSKTMLASLFTEAFGDANGDGYIVNGDESMITQGSAKSGSATPEWATTRDCKAIFWEEPATGSSLESQKLKKSTGGSRNSYRHLYGSLETIVQDYLNIILTNHVPPMKNIDMATRDRMAIMKFIGRWVEDPPETSDERNERHLYEKDENFPSRVKYYTEAFHWVLCQVHEDFLNMKLRKPEAVVNANDNYWNRTDYYTIFKNKMLDKPKTDVAKKAYIFWKDGKTDEMSEELAGKVKEYDISFDDDDPLTMEDSFMIFKQMMVKLVTKVSYDRLTIESFENEITGTSLFGNFTGFEKEWATIYLKD